MRSPSWFKDELWREIAAVLEQKGRHDLAEQLRRSHKPGPRPRPGIVYRQIAQMWERFKLQHNRHVGGGGERLTDEILRDRFLGKHGKRIAKLLGLKVSNASLRNIVGRGNKDRGLIRPRRLSRWHKSGRYIVPSLRPYLVTDPDEAAYMHAVVQSIFLKNQSDKP